MNIRKQLDGLIKKEDIDSKDIQWALAMLEVLRDYGIRRVVDEENKIQQYTKLESEDLSNIKGIIKLLERIDNKLNSKPDLDKWAERNQKIDTEEPEEEKGLVSSAARAIGGDELV